MGNLCLHIHSTRPEIHQVFNFFHPERSFHKRSVRLPLGRPDDAELTVKCSDPAVVAYASREGANDYVDVVVKASAPRSPEVSI